MDEKVKAPIMRLNQEDLENIFGFLSVPDKVSAALVCWSWHNAAYLPSVWRNVEASFSTKNVYPTLYQSMAKRGIRKVSLLSFDESGLQDLLKTVPNIQRLELFDDLEDSSQILIKAFIQPMPNLTHLNMSSCVFVTDNCVEIILQRCPNLETLLLDGRRLTSASLLSVARHLRNLKFLKVFAVGTVTDNDITEGICGGDPTMTGNLNLVHLHLGGRINVTGNGVHSIQLHLNKLKYLSLSGCSQLTNAGVDEISRMQLLHTLVLTENENITDEGLVHLVSMVNLRHLSLRKCPGIGDHAMTLLAGMANLRQLNVSDCIELTDDGLAILANRGSRLSRLELCSCPRLTDAGMQHVAKMRFLRELNLQNTNIGDEGMNLLDTGGSQVVVLELHSTNVGDNAMFYLSQLCFLRELSLRLCSVSDWGLEILSDGAPSLVHLDLTMVQELTDVGLQYLARMRRLKKLNIKACSKVTRLGLGYLFEGAARITCLIMHDGKNDVSDYAKTLGCVKFGFTRAIFDDHFDVLLKMGY